MTGTSRPADKKDPVQKQIALIRKNIAKTVKGLGLKKATQ